MQREPRQYGRAGPPDRRGPQTSAVSSSQRVTRAAAGPAGVASRTLGAYRRRAGAAPHRSVRSAPRWRRVFATAGAGHVTLRLFFAAVVLLLISPPTLRLDRRTLPIVLAYGLVLGVMNLLQQAILRIPLGIAATIEFSVRWRCHWPGPAACKRRVGIDGGGPGRICSPSFAVSCPVSACCSPSAPGSL